MYLKNAFKNNLIICLKIFISYRLSALKEVFLEFPGDTVGQGSGFVTAVLLGMGHWVSPQPVNLACCVWPKTKTTHHVVARDSAGAQ